jgi:WD40 repeat protein
VHSSHQTMATSLKEHRREVTYIQITSDNQSFVSSSADGACIIWDLVRSVPSGGMPALRQSAGPQPRLCQARPGRRGLCTEHLPGGHLPPRLEPDRHHGVELQGRAVGRHSTEADVDLLGLWQLTYWDVYDCNAIREVTGGNAALMTIDVTPKGDVFACGGADRLVRVRAVARGLP